MCPPHTLSIDILSIFLHPGAAMHVLNPVTLPHWMQLPTSSPTAWSDSSSTLAPGALLLGGWHTHWGPTTTLQLPLAMFHLHACAYLHFQPDHHIWTCPSVPAIPVPRAVWPTTSPKKPSFQLIGAPIRCPPPPISLWHSMHAHTHMF